MKPPLQKATGLKIWPAPGRRVRDPVTGQMLGRKGATVPASTYWQRRLASGDVTLDSGRAQKAPPSRPDAAVRRQSKPKPHLAPPTPRSSSATRDSAPKESPAR